MSNTTINGYQLYHGFLSGYLSIAKEREYLNSINVFPVPDGDTGTNMLHTFSSIIHNLEPSRSAKKVLDHIADLALDGARGNSGIILSQYLIGLSKYSGDNKEISISDFGKAVKNSVSDAYNAMEKPMEGTILTVMKVWSDVIHSESRNHIDIDDVLSKALSAAKMALAHTTEQLQVLKDNKVQDAGARGFVSFLEGIGKISQNGLIKRSTRKEILLNGSQFSSTTVVHQHRETQDLQYRYCTEVLLGHSDIQQNLLKEKLRTMGDSLIISSGKNKTRIHLHTNSPAQIVSTVNKYGTIIQQKVDDMVRQEQVVNRRLGKIAVVTDSIADIPLELLDKYQIHVLNLNMTWGDDHFLDRLTITPLEFYKQQQLRKEFPESATPSMARVVLMYQYLLEHYEGIIVLPVAKALSGTWRLMSLAAEKYNKDKKRIEIVDTCLNSVAQGLLVHKIGKEAAEGKSLEDLRFSAEKQKRQIKIFVSVETFKFMVKGGRVSPLKGAIAKLLNLKPIVSLDENGKGVALEKAFSANGLLWKIKKIVSEIDKAPGILEYAVVHAASRERAEYFADIIKEITGMAPLYITDISPIVGMHSGKGAIAIGVVKKSS